MYEITLSATSVVLFTVLAIYLIIRERTAANVFFCVLLVLLASIEVTDQLLLRHPFSFVGYEKMVLFPESLLPAAILLFGFSYGRPNLSAGLSFMKRCLLAATLIFPAIIFVTPLNDLFYAPDMHNGRMLFLGTIGYWYYAGIMICCVIALVNIETVFSAMPEAIRHKMKFELIGICSILAVLIFYFSRELLFRTINMNLIPARSGILIVSALLIGYSRLSVGVMSEAAKVSVSRYMLYRSLTLLFVGIYFVLLRIIGEGMKYFEMPFSTDLAIFLSFLAGISMAGLFLSESLRRRVKVFVSKHFYTHKYDYRAKWLAFTERLALCRALTDVQNVVVSTFMDTFGLKGISLYLLDREKNLFFLSTSQDMTDPVKELSVPPKLRSYFIAKGRVLNPSDGEYEATDDENDYFSRSGTGLVIPLIAGETIEGLIVCGKQLAPEKIIYEDYDMMKMLARQAALSLVNFRLSEELAETREMAAVARISSFIIHDLKNHAYSLSLLLENAEAHMKNPEFQSDMIETVKNTAYAMKDIIDKLKRIPEKISLDRKMVDLSLLTGATVEEINKFNKGPIISFQGQPVYVMVDPDEIKKVIVNMILNACDAISGTGRIVVATGSNSMNGFIRIEDNGCGMTEDFIIGSLFKPFKSSKKSGLGIGLFQCKQIVEAHCGGIEVRSSPGDGSTFTVFLPNPDQ
jgi:hypothetical protein